MKICFICDSIFSFGGVQRVLAVISKALSANHSVTILTMDDPANEDMSMYDLNQSAVAIRYFKYPHVPLYKLFPNKVYSFLYKKLPLKNKFTSKLYSYSSFPPTYRKLLVSQMNNEKYDVIVGVHAFIALRLAIVRQQLKAQKVVGWMHNSYDAFFNTRKVFLWEQKDQFRHEMPKLDRIIVLSENDKLHYQNEMQLATTVVPNPLTIEAAAKCDISAKTFLAVGRLTYAKGFDILINAFSDFAKQNNEWTLNIVGEGTEKQKLLEIIKAKQLNSRVSIYPFTKDIQDYYSSSSVFVLSSRWEGMPLVMNETMAYGLPIIASDLPVIKEILDKQTNALIFESGNKADLATKLCQIVNMDLESMSKHSIEVSKRFSLPSVIARWENIIK